jgi:hypothetical protein
LWIATVFPPYSFYFFMIFSKIIVVNFTFLIMRWLRIITITFLTKHSGLLQYFSKWFFFVFLWYLFFGFFLFFFQNSLCRFYIFNIELIENLALWFFFFKTLWIATVFPHMFFLNDFFFQNYFCRLYFF